MVQIPDKLARSIRTGQCVLWAGAGLEKADDDAPGFGALPWAGCIATAHPNKISRWLRHDDRAPIIVAPHELSGRRFGEGERFVLHATGNGGGWPKVPDLTDIFDEAACARTNLLVGFQADDPDLRRILDTLARAGTSGQRFAVVEGWSEPEREAIVKRYGVQVIEGDALLAVTKAIVDAAQVVTGDEEEVETARARVDLLRAVDGVPTRVDFGDAAALQRDDDRIAALLDRLSYDNLPPTTLLQAGTVLFAHGKIDAAKACFAAAQKSDDSDAKAVAALDLAWAAFAAGDRDAAVAGLRALATESPALAIVPADVELQSIVAHNGPRAIVRGKTGDAEIDLEITHLPRALGTAEVKAFDNCIAKLRGIDAEPLAGVTGGRISGRRLVVEHSPAAGVSLRDKLQASGRMTLEATMDVIRPLTESLATAHDAGLVHGSIASSQVFIGSDGRPILRGFGPAAALGRFVSARDLAEGVVAPEVLGGADATAKADAYAVAALAYRCLTGVPAVVGAAPSAFAEDLDPRVDAALARAMHPDPSQRASVRELEDALVGVVRSPVVRAVVEPVTSAQITLPEDKDDLEAWAWILDRKPAHAEARANVERIEQEARGDGRWDRVAEVLSVRAQHAQVQQDRVAILSELASVFEQHLGAPANAFETMQSLIEEVPVPSQIELAVELERLAEVTGKWGPLADSLMIVAERVVDTGPQAKMYETLGRVFSERLGATDRAIAAYGKASEIAPSPVNLGALVPLHRKAGNHAELATALLSLADAQEGSARVESLIAAADVLQHDLGDAEGAFATLRAVLADAPTHVATLERAEPLARSLEDHEALFEILTRRADATLDTKQAAALRHEAASLAIAQLSDPSRAIPEYEAILDADRDDRQAADQLVALLRTAAADDPSKRAGLIDALSMLVEQVETPDERATLLTEAAGLLDQEPDGKEAAADRRERILEEVSLDRSIAQDAAAALERWYRRQESNDALARVLARVGRAEDAPEELRVDAWTKLLTLMRPGGVHEDSEGTLEALEALTKLRPDDKKVRDELLARYLEREEYEKAGPLIRAQVFDEEDPKRKAVLLLKGGRLREQIGKVEGAVEALEDAVALDATLWEAWLALRDLYRQREQPLKAIEAQVAAAKHHPQRTERVRLVYEAARTYIDDLDKPDRATDLLEELVELDPDHREGTGLLVERLVAAGDLKRAWPVAQTYVMQVRSQAAEDKPLNLRALSIAGRCALAVDEKERAREYLEKAKAFDATNLDLLQLLADLDMDAGRYADALRNYQSVILGVGSKMPPAELAQVYVKMADARIGMAEKPKAVQMAERALEIDPDCESAIEKLIELAPDTGGAAAMVKAKQRMQEVLGRREARISDDPKAAAAIREERGKLLRAIAKLQQEDLGGPIEAVRTLEMLLDLQPDDLAVLHQILEILTGAERWRDATNVLERLAAAQENPMIRAKYVYAGAAILREHLRDLDAAMAWFRRALEDDPMHERAFDQAAELLREIKSWKELARLYRARLKRMSADAPVRVRARLFNELGEIYEKHLNDPKTAIAAYGQAIASAPADQQNDPALRERRSHVMRLAVSLGDDEIDKAIVAGHSLIITDPTDFETYHRLVELYLRRGSKDRARALARTLVFVKQADEAEEELARESGGTGSVARGKMGREIWRKHVYHPFQNRRVSDILSLVWPIIAAREGHTHAHHEIANSNRVELALQSPDTVARFFAHACQVLDVASPDYYRRDDGSAVVVDALCVGEGKSRKVRPTVIAGKAATSETSEAVIKFRAGRAIARTRPEHILAAILPSASNLRNAVYGAIAAAVPDATVPADIANEARRYAELYKKYLAPAVLEQIGVLGSKVIAKGDIDMRKWVQGASYTVTRAGFILSDSIEVAAKVLTQEGDAGMAVPYKERIRDLIAYSVSDPYLRVRKELGLGR